MGLLLLFTGWLYVFASTVCSLVAWVCFRCLLAGCMGLLPLFTGWFYSFSSSVMDGCMAFFLCLLAGCLVLSFSVGVLYCNYVVVSSCFTGGLLGRASSVYWLDV
jgi:hypothetical protein